MKKHKHVKKHKKVHSQKVVVLFFLSLVAFACIVLFKNSRESVLGSTVGSPGTVTQQGTQEEPTSAPLPTAQPTSKVLIQPTTPPTVQPTTEPIAQPTTAQLPQVTPTPTLVVPQEPIYVPVVDPLRQDPITVDLADDATTVVIEQTAGGLVTTTEQLTPKNEPIPQSETIITSQTGQAATNSTTPVTNVTTEPSVIDKFIALLSGQAPEPATVQQSSTVIVSTEQSKTENQPVLYQQVYVSDSSAPTYTTDAKETVAAMDQWLGLNDMKLSASGTESFNISQAGIDALVYPTDNKVAVNLSRMELLVNTPSGFKPLSYLPDRATEYLKDLNVISTVDGAVTVRDTPTELVYDVKGTSMQYLFAFIPVPIHKNVCISAKTNEVCGIQQSMLSKVMDLFSI